MGVKQNSEEKYKKLFLGGIGLFALLALVFYFSPLTVTQKSTIQGYKDTVSGQKKDIDRLTGQLNLFEQGNSLNRLSKLQNVKVTKVIDGDTIEVEGGLRFQYMGVYAPQDTQCYSKESYEANKELVEGKQVRIEVNENTLGSYQRLLDSPTLLVGNNSAYVYVGDVFVNEYMVRNGYAFSSSYPMDFRYSLQLIEAQNQAKNQKLGVWGQSCQYNK